MHSGNRICDFFMRVGTHEGQLIRGNVAVNILCSNEAFRQEKLAFFLVAFFLQVAWHPLNADPILGCVLGEVENLIPEILFLYVVWLCSMVDVRSKRVYDGLTVTHNHCRDHCLSEHM